jgi:hypothetical protein
MNSSWLSRAGQAANVGANLKPNDNVFQPGSIRQGKSASLGIAPARSNMTVKNSSPSHPENYPERTLANIRLDL